MRGIFKSMPVQGIACNCNYDGTDNERFCHILLYNTQFCLSDILHNMTPKNVFPHLTGAVPGCACIASAERESATCWTRASSTRRKTSTRCCTSSGAPPRPACTRTRARNPRQSSTRPASPSAPRSSRVDHDLVLRRPGHPHDGGKAPRARSGQAGDSSGG